MGRDTTEVLYAGAEEVFTHTAELGHFIPTFSTAQDGGYRDVEQTFQAVLLQMVTARILDTF